MAKNKILIIDDDEKLNDLLQNYLSGFGYNVLTFTHPEEGLKKIKKEIPDLVILDIMLPDMDGFAVCKELKENQNTKGIPVVMLTSIGHHLTEPDYAKAMAVTHEADDFIEKPIEAKELLNRIRKIVGPNRRLV